MPLITHQRSWALAELGASSPPLNRDPSRDAGQQPAVLRGV